jgi:hypothetical protein
VCKRGNGWPGKGVGRGGEVRPRGVEFGGGGGGAGVEFGEGCRERVNGGEGQGGEGGRTCCVCHEEMKCPVGYCLCTGV